jgi:hypothetical protein
MIIPRRAPRHISKAITKSRIMMRMSTRED